MNTDLLGPLMFAAALVLIFTGYPVAFALGGTALIFAGIGIAVDLFSFSLLQAMPVRIFGIMQNYTLLAVPFFIFMGTLLERSGLAEDLLKTMGLAFGRLRGGLGLSVVVVGTLLAAATGVVGATVVAMGLIALPVMLRYNYSKELATGIICASGTLGQVIPPSIVLIVVVLGSIFVGLATPTEAGAFGAVGAMILAAFNRRLTLAALRGSLDTSSRLTSMVLFILIGSQAFSLVFRGLYGDIWVEDLLTSLPGGAIGFLIAVNTLIFVLGFFIDFFEIAFIVLPLLAPAARALGIVDERMIWFGVMIAINLQTSFLTPPFGFSLFYLRGVAPEGITTAHIYRGVIPFILIQLLGLTAIIVWPEIVTTLLTLGVGRQY